MNIASMLYAEVYLICVIVVALLLYWTLRKEAVSANERWMRRVLIAFLLNFISNFFFTLFNGMRIAPAWMMATSYFFKTAYHMTLCVGAFAWCGYAAAVQKSALFETRKTLRLLLIPLALPILLTLINLRTHWLFEITETGRYQRNFLFHLEMWYLFLGTGFFSVRLLHTRRFESDPTIRAHMLLTATFPLCILAAWLLAFIGEAVPVICVSIMVELLCLYMGTTQQQVSMDKLTLVNNRHNLLSYLDYKLKNNDGSLHLLMIDVDYFKKINDTYGHLEGDAALVRVASALKRACGDFKKRPYIARYGGDEFIIVLEAQHAEIEALCDAIRSILAESAAAAKVPYTVSISIGIAKMENGMDSKTLIGEADAALYRIKHAR